MNIPFSVEIDHRESASEVAKLLTTNDSIHTHYTCLNTGDYLINNSIIIERKTLDDLVNSIIDGRLFQQAMRLGASDKWKAIILEGKKIRYQMTRESIQGALITTAVQFKIPILWAKNAEETVKLMRYMAEKFCQKPTATVSERFGRKPKRFHSQGLHILQGFPSIGPDRAHKLLTHFKTVYAVVNASKESLQTCPGIGKDTAETVYNIIHGIRLK